LRKDGHEIEVEVTTNAAYCHRAKLIFCNCRDITDRKLGVTAILDDEDADHFFKRLDAALYEAKQAGRNRVITRPGSVAAPK
jgi:hypothetical protein